MKMYRILLTVIAILTLTACASATYSSSSEPVFNAVDSLEFNDHVVKLTTADGEKTGLYNFKWCDSPDGWELEIVQYGGSERKFVLPSESCKGWEHLRAISARKTFPKSRGKWDDLDDRVFRCQ